MKKTAFKILSLLLSLLCMLSCFAFASCKGNDDLQSSEEIGELWKNAIYTSDTTLGSGSKSVRIKVLAGETSVTLTVKTNKTTLADALLEHGLITGDEGPYGLYIKTVNGILADWDVDQTYWEVGINGKAATSGASDIEIADGEQYEFTLKK